MILANPKKLRVIAESTKKTDRLDAQILTEFLVLDMIPRAYQPTPRQREHRTLVRHRRFLQSRISSVRSKVHHILSNYNADRKDLFSAQGGPAYFKEVPFGDADRFVINNCGPSGRRRRSARGRAEDSLRPSWPRRRRAKEERTCSGRPRSGFRGKRGGIPRVALSEAVPHRRGRGCLRGGGAGGAAERGEVGQGYEVTREAPDCCGGRWWVGLAAGPEQPEMGGEVAGLKERKGKERAIVAVARKLLCVLYAMLRTRTRYKIVTTEAKAPRTPGSGWWWSGRRLQNDHNHSDSDSGDDTQDPGPGPRLRNRPQPRRRPDRARRARTRPRPRLRSRPQPHRQPNRGRHAPTRPRPDCGPARSHGDGSPEDDAEVVGQDAGRRAKRDYVAGHPVRDQPDNGGQTRTEQNDTPVRASHLLSEGRWT